VLICRVYAQILPIYHLLFRYNYDIRYLTCVFGPPVDVAEPVTPPPTLPAGTTTNPPPTLPAGTTTTMATGVHRILTPPPPPPPPTPFVDLFGTKNGLDGPELGIRIQDPLPNSPGKGGGVGNGKKGGMSASRTGGELIVHYHHVHCSARVSPTADSEPYIYPCTHPSAMRA